MSWRQKELEKYGHEVAWLAATDAAAAFASADSCSSKTRYGLNEATFSSVERLDVETEDAASREWLQRRVGTDAQLLLVFGQADVCSVRAGFFLEHWRDLFCPSRDDVVILPTTDHQWVLFYCHEDEFEFGKCSAPPNQGVAADGHLPPFGRSEGRR
jgi:hypothetical protein